MVQPEATNDDTIWRICVACWINKATRACTRPQSRGNTLTQACALINTDQYLILTASPLQQWFVSAPEYHVLRTLPVLCNVTTKCWQSWPCGQRIHSSSVRKCIFMTGNNCTVQLSIWLPCLTFLRLYLLLAESVVSKTSGS